MGSGITFSGGGNDVSTGGKALLGGGITFPGGGKALLGGGNDVFTGGRALLGGGNELMINEAIIDAGIGMAKFNNEYYEGYMPKVGCPGCNSYTMECMEQD